MVENKVNNAEDKDIKKCTEESEAEKIEDKEVAELIAKVMKVPLDGIKNVSALKKGMTNRSFIFEYEDKKYIMRIPGNGSKETVNREEEAAVYNINSDKDICDNIIYINPYTG